MDLLITRLFWIVLLYNIGLKTTNCWMEILLQDYLQHARIYIYKLWFNYFFSWKFRARRAKMKQVVLLLYSWVGSQKNHFSMVLWCCLLTNVRWVVIVFVVSCDFGFGPLPWLQVWLKLLSTHERWPSSGFRNGTATFSRWNIVLLICFWISLDRWVLSLEIFPFVREVIFKWCIGGGKCTEKCA